MDYTTNYHLPQWVETDRVQMEDFNQMCADIDQGITEEREAREAADAALAALVTQAQTTANTAYCPSNKPFTAGTYLGNGGEMTITLGFRPSFVIINGLQNAHDAMTLEEFHKYCGMTSGNTLDRRIQFTDTGFLLYPSDPTHCYYPNFTKENLRYDYIAFR